jgi:hypothetical protein
MSLNPTAQIVREQPKLEEPTAAPLLATSYAWKDWPSGPRPIILSAYSVGCSLLIDITLLASSAAFVAFALITNSYDQVEIWNWNTDAINRVLSAAKYVCCPALHILISLTCSRDPLSFQSFSRLLYLVRHMQSSCGAWRKGSTLAYSMFLLGARLSQARFRHKSELARLTSSGFHCLLCGPYHHWVARLLFDRSVSKPGIIHGGSLCPTRCRLAT